MRGLLYGLFVVIVGFSVSAHSETRLHGLKKGNSGGGKSVSNLSRQPISALRAGQNLAAFTSRLSVSTNSTGHSLKTASVGSNLFQKFPLKIQAVSGNAPTKIKWNRELGTPRYMEFVVDTKAPASIPDKATAINIARQFLRRNAELLKIQNPDDEFTFTSSSQDKEGFTHVRFQQRYNGTEVWAKDAYVHLNTSGQVFSFNGVYVPSPTSLSGAQYHLSESDGIQTTTADLKGKGMSTDVKSQFKKMMRYGGPSARKVIWVDAFHVPHLALFVEVRTGIDHDWYYFIDGVDGKILRSYDNVDHDGPVQGSGVDLNGVTRSFSVYQVGSTYYLLDASQAMYDAAHSQIPDNAIGAIMALDLRSTDLSSQSQFYYVTSTNNTWTDASTVSAQFNAAITYNYYRTTFGRNSIDDSGMTIYSVVHVTSNGASMANAFWNGGLMAYGDGGQVFNPLAGGLDVAAHEMTHGVTQHSANLEYVDQSGALNESISDAFAVMVDTSNWQIGEQVMKDLVDYPTGALRDLSNPHNGGSAGSASWQPAAMSEFVSTTEDNGGVHTNSGIPNHALYLVASSIGRSAASHIWYKALTNYLTRSSQFVDARIATVNAAGELYGQSSSQVTAVKNAWSSVGVTDSVATPTPPPTQVMGPNWLLVTNTSPSDPNTLYMAKTVIQSNSDYSALSTTTVSNRPAVSDDGSLVIFVDGDHKLRALYTNPGNPQEAFLDTSSVWESVAIGPGLSSIALTSIYIDTTIYYYNFNTQQAQDFKIATQSYDGPPAKTALYADEMSFDPTGNLLLFDCYNQVPGAQGDTLRYWNIDLLDVTSGKMVNVFPQQSGIDLANPAFAKTSTNRFTFDYLDEKASNDYVMAADFNTGNSGIVSGPQNVLGFPTYSSDDDTIAYHTLVDYQSALHDGIDKMPLLSDQLTGSGTAQSHSLDAAFPVWFAIGTRVTGVQTRGGGIPAEFSLSQNYPNPFNPSTTITYAVPEKEIVSVKVFDILGQVVETLVNEEQSPGTYTVKFEGGALSSGLYLCVARAGNYSAIRKMLLLK